MRREIIITIPAEQEIILHHKKEPDVIINYVNNAEHINLGVSNFPVFQHVSLDRIAPFVAMSVIGNVLTENTVKLLDPFKIKDIDSKTLEELNIYQNKDYYSVN